MTRREYDFYPTPDWCFEDLPLDWERFTGAHEPCGGDGRLVNFLQSKGITTTYSEIAKKRDIERLASRAKTEENIKNYN